MADTTEQIAKPEDVTPVAEPAPADNEAPTTNTDDALDAALNEDDDDKSKRVTLADLSAKGTALYAHKNYEEAAEIFSRASVLQAEINGETAPENAEILFHYGRSLFKVGQSKSDVLGGSAPATEKKPAKGKAKANGQPKAAKPAVAKTAEEKVTQEGVAIVAADKDSEQSKEGAEDKKSTENKPLFQFTGDENFDDSDDEEQEEEQEEEEDDDDLATAFEVLDLARVCYAKLLEKYIAEEAEGKGKEVAEDSPQVRHVKERLADTHDALSEISLENELYVTPTHSSCLDADNALQIPERHRGRPHIPQVQD